MAATAQRPKLIVIVGPTASGKSDLAMMIAKKFNGEIIAADSRTIYKGMDIGTAKPSTKDRKEVPHWGLDIVDPGQPFSAYKFKKYAKEVIADVQNRDKLPILVGGTGLYIDAVLFDYQFSSPGNERDEQNSRHRKRGSYEVSSHDLEPSVYLVGLKVEPKELKKNIDRRAEKIFSSGVVEESRQLLEKYGEEKLEKTGGIVYKVCPRLLRGEIQPPEALQLFKTADWQYARRQRTWFKRNKFIHWFDNTDEAFTSVINTLNK
jgi:tRNA dimethylallyltransferase